MLKELYQEMRGDFKTNAHPQIAKIDLVSDVAYLEGGKLVIRKGDTPPKYGEAFDIQNLIDHAAGWENPEVWYNSEKITLFRENPEEKDKIVMNLSWSPQFKKCMELENQKLPINQANLRKLLKTDFYGCFPENLVEAVSQVKWNIDTAGEGTIQRGKSSLGSSIQAKIEGLKEIPEYVDANIPIFLNKISFAANIRFYIDPDPKTQNFIFHPLPLEIENAKMSAEAKIKDLLSEMPELTKVYYGAC